MKYPNLKRWEKPDGGKPVLDVTKSVVISWFQPPPPPPPYIPLIYFNYYTNFSIRQPIYNYNDTKKETIRKLISNFKETGAIDVIKEHNLTFVDVRVEKKYKTMRLYFKKKEDATLFKLFYIQKET